MINVHGSLSELTNGILRYANKMKEQKNIFGFVIKDIKYSSILFFALIERNKTFQKYLRLPKTHRIVLSYPKYSVIEVFVIQSHVNRCSLMQSVISIRGDLRRRSLLMQMNGTFE